MKVLSNPFYLMAILFFVADAAVLALMNLWLGNLAPAIPDIVWTRIHLLTIGVLIQAVVGMLPSLLAAKTGLRMPGPGLQWSIWVLLNVSFVALLVSVPTDITLVALTGAIGVFLAIILLLIGVLRTETGRSAMADPRRRLLLAGPVSLLVGILLAMSLIGNWPAPAGIGGVLEAHPHDPGGSIAEARVLTILLEFRIGHD